MGLPHSVSAETPSTLLFTAQLLPGYLKFSFMPGYIAALTRARLGKIYGKGVGGMAKQEGASQQPRQEGRAEGWWRLCLQTSLGGHPQS